MDTSRYQLDAVASCKLLRRAGLRFWEKRQCELPVNSRGGVVGVVFLPDFEGGVVDELP